MNKQLIYLLLLAISSCQSFEIDDTTGVKLPDNPILSFNYTTTDGVVESAEILNDSGEIIIWDLVSSDQIASVEYTLDEGVTITPDPSTRIGSWQQSEYFKLECGDESRTYSCKMKSTQTQATLYPLQTYGRETKHFLYDLKLDSDKILSSAEEMVTEHGINGVRFPIWTGTLGDYATGHPSAGVVQTEVYDRFVTRTLEVMKWYKSMDEDDFQLFISIKSNGQGLPDWCYEDGVFIPQNYAQLVFDLIKHLKDNYDLTVTVVGLDNESAFAVNSDNGTVWMYSETVVALRKMIEECEEGYSTPRFISTETWAPKTFIGGWLEYLLNTAPETIDIYGVHYYTIKDHPNNFERLEDEWDGTNSDKSREFWATEMHGLSSDSLVTYENDVLKIMEKVFCALWAQRDLGLDALSWWGYNVTDSLTYYLQKAMSVPLRGSTPIKFVDHDDDGFDKSNSFSNYDDVCRDYDIYSDNLKTRASINGNEVRLFIINVAQWSLRDSSNVYDDYSIRVDGVTLAEGEISCQRWSGTELSADDYVYDEFTIERPTKGYFTIDIAPRSITCIVFNIVQPE